MKTVKMQIKIKGCEKYQEITVTDKDIDGDKSSLSLTYNGYDYDVDDSAGCWVSQSYTLTDGRSLDLVVDNDGTTAYLNCEKITSARAIGETDWDIEYVDDILSAADIDIPTASDLDVGNILCEEDYIHAAEEYLLGNRSAVRAWIKKGDYANTGSVVVDLRGDYDEDDLDGDYEEVDMSDDDEVTRVATYIAWSKEPSEIYRKEHVSESFIECDVN